MKKMKTVLSSVLALTMTLSFSMVPVYAANEGASYKDGTYTDADAAESDGTNIDAYDIATAEEDRGDSNVETTVSLASDTAAYNPNGTTFAVAVTNPQSDVDYTELTIGFSAGRESGTLEKGTDYSVELTHSGKAMDEYTVTILSGGSYNKLGQSLTVAFAGTELGTVAIKSTAAVSIENNTLKLTGGNGETLANYIAEITTVTVDGTEYPTVERKGVHTVYEVSDFFKADGSVNFDSDKFSDGAKGTYTISVEANGFENVEATVGGQSEPSVSSNTITVPEGLADGNYKADVIVEPDDDEDFNFYPITVTVTVKDGAITNIAVSGASGNNTQYSYNAETGISEQVCGKTAGVYDVDVVSMATCSSKAIIKAVNIALQGEPVSSTALTLSNAIYDPDGTSFTLTVTEPEENVDYSDIALSYALGKFANSLTINEDYTVALVSETDFELVYQVTILKDATFDIEDDTAGGTRNYNTIGQNLDVTVAGTSAGRIVITSSAEVAITDNVLTLTGGNGETLEEYISFIADIALSYIDKDGETVTDSYTTQTAHDVPPTYTGSDFFNADGSVNFQCGAFVYGENWTYTITVEAGGFETIIATIGNQNEPADPEQPTKPEKPGNSEQPTDPEKPGNSEQPANSEKPGNSGQLSNPGQSGSTQQASSNNNGTASSTGKTNTVKTGDENHVMMWLSILILSCAAFTVLVVKKNKKHS